MFVIYGRCFGRIKQTRIMLPMIFSRGWPFFSYMASRKNGSMTSIMQIVAALEPVLPLSKKKSGTPTSAPLPKHSSCLFVRPNMTLVFIAFKSLGTGTYAKLHHLPQWALNRLFARLPVLNSVKHSSTVYPMQVQIAAVISGSATMF